MVCCFLFLFLFFSFLFFSCSLLRALRMWLVGLFFAIDADIISKSRRATPRDETTGHSHPANVPIPGLTRPDPPVHVEGTPPPPPTTCPTSNDPSSSSNDDDDDDDDKDKDDDKANQRTNKLHLHLRNQSTPFKVRGRWGKEFGGGGGAQGRERGRGCGCGGG